MHRHALLAVGVFAVLSSAVHAEDVPNPAYAAWAKCPPGTTLTFTLDEKNGSSTTKQKVTHTLLEATPAAVQIEVKSVGGSATQPATTTSKLSIPAKISKGRELLPFEAPEKFTITDMKEGKEVLTIAGAKIETATHEYTLSYRSDPTGAVTHEMVDFKVKIWTSPEIPGSVVQYQYGYDMFFVIVDIRMATTEFKIATPAQTPISPKQ
jgi:hypothetical protein